ncbi:MAG: hypothetical protein PHG25_00225 [Candidatus Pacebacteria bacterium]|nr:hypothetical protein [Candidatus Paceibacterota bacterium]
MKTNIVYPAGWQVIGVTTFASPTSTREAYTAFLPPHHTAIDIDTVFMLFAHDCTVIKSPVKCTGGRSMEDKNSGSNVFYTYSNNKDILDMFDSIVSKNKLSQVFEN